MTSTTDPTSFFVGFCAAALDACPSGWRQLGNGLLQRTLVSGRTDVYGYAGSLLEQDPRSLLQRHAANVATQAVAGNATNGTVANTVASLSGVQSNGAGDISALLSTILATSTLVVWCFLVFSVLRRYFKWVYEHKAGNGGLSVPDTYFGWIKASWKLSIDQIVDVAGLDLGMLVAFARLSLQILAMIGAPMATLFVPLHTFFGDGQGVGALGKIDFANVKKGSWICWIHAFAVWYVVVVTQMLVHNAMRSFLPRRAKWMRELPDPRATTVLVEEIPMGVNTEAALTEYFDSGVFGRPAVKTVYIVKDTSVLLPLIHRLEVVKRGLIPGMEKVAGIRKEKRNHHQETLLEQKRHLEEEIEVMREHVQTKDEFNSHSAFVTFFDRREATVALKMFSDQDEEEIVVSMPPCPSDVIWAHLISDPGGERVREIIGYLLIAGLFCSFFPIVLGISSITSLETLQDTVPFFADIIQNHPAIATAWNGLMGSFALILMMGLVPTLFMLIFKHLFCLKAAAWSQLYLMQWYFYFLIIFVLLVTALGTSVIQTSKELLDHPTEFFELLANHLPMNSHFYLNFITLQWGSFALGITRTVPLMKYAAMRCVSVSAEHAHQLAEPEDQDFHGIGSRSARLTLVLIIPLVFCTLSPLISFLALITFSMANLVYSYLFAFAETTKPDLGGAFWYMQLLHVQQGLFLHIALLTGVLMQKSDSWVPWVISASATGFLIVRYKRFKAEFRWENPSVHDFLGDGKALQGNVGVSAQPSRTHSLSLLAYRQPELPLRQARPTTQATVAVKEALMPGMQSLQDAAAALQSRISGVGVVGDPAGDAMMGAPKVNSGKARWDKLMCCDGGRDARRVNGNANANSTNAQLMPDAQ